MHSNSVPAPDNLREAILKSIAGLLQVPVNAIPLFADENTAALILGVKPNTLQNWRSTGRYALPFTKSGKCVRYPIPGLVEFVLRRTHQHDLI